MRKFVLSKRMGAGTEDDSYRPEIRDAVVSAGTTAAYCDFHDGYWLCDVDESVPLGPNDTLLTKENMAKCRELIGAGLLTEKRADPERLARSLIKAKQPEFNREVFKLGHSSIAPERSDR